MVKVDGADADGVTQGQRRDRRRATALHRVQFRYKREPVRRAGGITTDWRALAGDCELVCAFACAAVGVGYDDVKPADHGVGSNCDVGSYLTRVVERGRINGDAAWIRTAGDEPLSLGSLLEATAGNRNVQASAAL